MDALSRLLARAAGTAAACVLIAAPTAGAFGPGIDVSPAGSANGGVGVAARDGGGVVVAWRRATDGAVLVRRAAVGGTLGDPVVAATGSSAHRPVVGRVPGGTAVAWVRSSDDHLLVRRVAEDGSLGTTFDVSGESLNSVNGQAALATNASGRVAVAWRRPSDSAVRIRVFEIGSGPSVAALDLSAAPDIALYGTNVHVGLNDAGEAAVVWHRNTDCHIIVRRVTSAGAVGTQIDISGEPDSAVGDTSPGVVVRPDGAVVAAWHRDSDHHAVSRRWNANGALDGFVDLSPAGDVPSMADLAIIPTSDGEAVAWQRASDSHATVAFGGGTTFSAGTDVSLTSTASGPPPAVAVSTDAALAVAWLGSDGTARVAFQSGVSGPGDSPPPPGDGGAPTPPPPPAAPAPPGGTPGRTPSSDRTAPGTRIASGPGTRLRERRATFRFTATEAGARFECALDDDPFAACSATTTLRHLNRGAHVLRVRAVDAAGNRDRTPARVRFVVPKRRR